MILFSSTIAASMRRASKICRFSLFSGNETLNRIFDVKASAGKEAGGAGGRMCCLKLRCRNKAGLQHGARQAAGLPWPSPTRRLSLLYRAREGGRVLGCSEVRGVLQIPCTWCLLSVQPVAVQRTPSGHAAVGERDSSLLLDPQRPKGQGAGGRPVLSARVQVGIQHSGLSVGNLSM